MKFQGCLFLILISSISSLSIRKSNTDLKKQVSHPFLHQNSVGFNAGIHQRLATSSGLASPYSTIPSNHPVLTDFKRPRYVEKLHFYEDAPAKRNDHEAIALNPNSGTYYQPFMNQAYSLRARQYTNCEDIHSSFVCQSTGQLCGWDRQLNSCIYISQHPHYHSIRFKENLPVAQKKK